MARDPTRAEWQSERAELLAELRGWCGEMPARGPLRTREAWRREYRTHTQIKLIYEGEPGETIPAYLLVPRDAPSGPLPAILAAHQCAWQCDVGKEQVVGKCVDWPDQAYGLELVREGFIVLAPDANKVGERYDPELREQWQTAAELGGQHACCTAPGGSWGPIRWKPVYDVMRGVDFLAAHQRVDRERIGMIGHSLGADTTLWAMPLEERITAAAISGGGIIADWLPYGLPYADILKLLAPRPFLEVVGRADPINWGETEPAPASVDERMRGKRDAHAQAREVYALDGAEERLACYEHEGGHCFPEEGRREAYAWLKKWLVP